MTPVTPSSVCDMHELLAGLVEIWNKKSGGRAGSPNHGHNIPGIWDSDNGVLAGKPCAECGLYDRARAALAERTQQEAQPEAVGVVDGDDMSRRILWSDKVAAFDYPVGTKLYTRTTSAANSTAPMQPSEVALIEKAALHVGMKSLMNNGAASCVYSEGCNGVTQAHLIAFAREIALHCAVALAAPTQAAMQPSPLMVDMVPPATSRDRWMYEQGRLAEREDQCARIKAADDAAADNDYMLDSNDCISVIRGTWKSPLANDCPPAPTQAAGGEADTDAVAEVIVCPTMGGQTLREIDGRWRFMKPGDKLYKMGAPYVRGYQDGQAAGHNQQFRAAAPAAAVPLSSMPDLQAAVTKGLADGSLVPQGAAAAPEGLTDERITKHTLLAKDCPPNSNVMLVSSLRRILAKMPATPDAKTAEAAPDLLAACMKTADAAGLPGVDSDELINVLRGLYVVAQSPVFAAAPGREAVLRKARIALAKATGSQS